MSEGFHALQEFMSYTKGMLYLLGVGYLVIFVAFWKFLHDREKVGRPHPFRSVSRRRRSLHTPLLCPGSCGTWLHSFLLFGGVGPVQALTPPGQRLSLAHIPW